MSDMSLEAPDADSEEQNQDLVPEVADPEEEPPEEAAPPLEADVADAADQSRELGTDDDDYR
ncbi:MAG TPA: hypothetical protein VGI58_11655 [Streptosporangiaceae bacterium]|jgi:hypothetical protein